MVLSPWADFWYSGHEMPTEVKISIKSRDEAEAERGGFCPLSRFVLIFTSDRD